jgi:hypothetical protein
LVSIQPIRCRARRQPKRIKSFYQKRAEEDNLRHLGDRR